MIKIFLNCLLIHINIQTILHLKKKRNKQKNEYQYLIKFYNKIAKLMVGRKYDS